MLNALLIHHLLGADILLLLQHPRIPLACGQTAHRVKLYDLLET